MPIVVLTGSLPPCGQQYKLQYVQLQGHYDTDHTTLYAGKRWITFNSDREEVECVSRTSVKIRHKEATNLLWEHSCEAVRDFTFFVSINIEKNGFDS